LRAAIVRFDICFAETRQSALGQTLPKGECPKAPSAIREQTRRRPPIADGQPANQYPTATAVERCETDQPGGAHPDRVTTPS
jgi:hypothetical protein